MRKETHYKLIKLAVGTWTINALVFIIFLFIKEYTKTIKHWSYPAWDKLWFTSACTKFLLTIAAPPILALIWDTEVTNNNTEEQ